MATPCKQRPDHFFLWKLLIEIKKLIIQELNIFIFDIKTFYQVYADEDSTRDIIITLIKANAWDVGVLSPLFLFD